MKAYTPTALFANIHATDTAVAIKVTCRSCKRQWGDWRNLRDYDAVHNRPPMPFDKAIHSLLVALRRHGSFLVDAAFCCHRCADADE